MTPELSPTCASETPDYSRNLNQNRRWALDEGSLFFTGQGTVHQTLRKLTAKLDSLGIPYAVAGGLALFQHGYRRFTEDIDLLVTPDGLGKIHGSLSGLGYVETFSGSRNLKDAETGVRIEFLTTGGFPGDGRPKPVAFPDPLDVSENLDGIQFLTLPALINLKLASGMSSPGRLKDLADVQELVKTLSLPVTFAEHLHPWVTGKYRELCAAAHEET